MKDKKSYWYSISRRGPITVTVLSKDRSITGIKGSNPARTTDVRLVFAVFCAGGGLCEELIARSRSPTVCVCPLFVIWKLEQ